jgi:ribosomal protein S18 acetylase RimI-like enzyme
MKAENLLIETPWDKKVLGINTYELNTLDEKILQQIATRPGHYTVKVDPLANKKLLHEYGFYYCDTLLMPHATQERFIELVHPEVEIARDIEVDALVAISHGAFEHDRYHRDFHIDREQADLRYDNWLRQLHASGDAFGLLFQGKLAAFFGLTGSHIVLHAVADKFRGRGLAKYLWSRACRELFDSGHKELTSSVSAANTAVINLYISLGFRFRNPVDIYHRVIA